MWGNLELRDEGIAESLEEQGDRSDVSLELRGVETIDIHGGCWVETLSRLSTF